MGLLIQLRHHLYGGAGAPHTCKRSRTGAGEGLGTRLDYHHVYVCVYISSIGWLGTLQYCSGIASSVRFILCSSRRRHQYLDTVVDSVLI